MEISLLEKMPSIFRNEEIHSISEQRRNQDTDFDKKTQPDTYTFSAEGLRLAKEAWIKKSLARTSNPSLEEDEEKTDIFMQGASGTTDASQSVTKSSNSQDSDLTSKIAKLEKQIKDLQKKIQDVYESDMPDIAKERQVKGLKEQLDSLLQQKGALQRSKIAIQ